MFAINKVYETESDEVIEHGRTNLFSLIFASINFRDFRDVARNAKIKTIFS